jgi:molybdopterin converting factor small subunit
MKVQVKLYATLQRYAPSGTELGKAFEIQFAGATIGDLVHHLGFEIDQAKIVMVNGIRTIDMNTRLNDNDLVVVFPPVGGG